MPNEFVARNGIIALNNTVVTGSVTATTGFTGSLFGTASWATNFITGSVTSASYAFTASSAVNSFNSVTASYAITSGQAILVTGSNAILSQSTAALTWSFDHNLNNRYPVFQVFNSASEVLIPERIVATSTTNALIYFSTPVSGIAVADIGGYTGSLTSISASYAFTASSAVSAAFAISAAYAPGGASLSGGATNYAAVWASATTLTTGSIFVTQSNVGIGTLTPTNRLQVSGSSNVMNIRGSGSAATSSIFTVDGAAGRLFSVNDSLSGSLFSVNTIAGLPVMEAFSDNVVRIGQYGQRALYVSQSRVGIGKEAPLNANLDVSGSVLITGSLSVSGSTFIVGPLNVSSSVSTTGSINTSGNVTITGSLTVSSTITAQTLVVQVITSSTSWITGSTQFGSVITNTHQFTGSILVSGSITGSRLNPRTVNTASAVIFTPNLNLGDMFTIVSQSSNLTFANPIGSPVDGQRMMIRLKDSGSARGLVFSGSQYRASTDLTFPVSSSLGKTLYMGFVYHAADVKWDLLAKLDNF